VKRRATDERPPMPMLAALLLLHRSSRHPEEELSWILGRVPDERDFAEARRVLGRDAS